MRTLGASGTGRTLGAFRTSSTSGTLRPVNTIAQHVGLRSAASRGEHQHITRVRGHDGKSRNIAGLRRVKRVWHAQHLLHTRHRVVAPTVRINLALQIVRTVPPVNIGEIALRGISRPNFQGHQTVGIRGNRLGLHINGHSGSRALEHADPNTHTRVRHQLVGGIAHHRLVTELRRRLREHADHAEQEKNN